MIIEPDFPDHWKTQMLIGLTQDKAAPMMVIRLWGHCQQRRCWVFTDLSSNALKAITRGDGDAEKIMSALVECGFIKKKGSQLIVHEWDTVNASLVRNWKNGGKGGRPKESQNNPEETQIDSGLTQTKPKTDLASSDREEKRREEKTQKRVFEYSKEFEDFWKIYPKKVSKIEGWIEWEKINPDERVREKIMSGISEQLKLEDFVKENFRFVPHASRWLKKRRWEDELKFSSSSVIQVPTGIFAENQEQAV